jgi:septal ring factor EnvC (AmiA/AmiB activator)
MPYGTDSRADASRGSISAPSGAQPRSERGIGPLVTEAAYLQATATGLQAEAAQLRAEAQQARDEWRQLHNRLMHLVARIRQVEDALAETEARLQTVTSGDPARLTVE